MMPLERLTSRVHSGAVVSTMSVPPSSLTAVARSSAGPTAAFHAKVTFPSESGALQRSSASAAGTMWLMERMIHPIIVPMRLVLASASPRRAELLRAAGFEFETLAVDVDERVLAGERPEDYVRRLAMEKSARAMASFVGSGFPGAPKPRSGEGGSRTRTNPPAGGSHVLILGADTAVVIDGDILGKPRDDKDAASMLRRLSGRKHEVLTGISLRGPTRESGRVETTMVEFSSLSEADIVWYVESGEGRDKAGAYAIQGLASRFIPFVDGSYSNVVGLPVAAVHELLVEIASCP
jgi:septum formation protein